MKIWFEYGSEHSWNLVLVGRFKDVSESKKAEEIIDRLRTLAAEADFDVSDPPERFPDEFTKEFSEFDIYTIAPQELPQFQWDQTVESKGSTLRVRTDESDVSAFLKILIRLGARVELFSGHDYPVESED